MRDQGFTVIEVILILLIVSILAAIPYIRSEDMMGIKVAASARKLQSDIAYAQELAMTRNLRHRVYFNVAPAPASGYAVLNDSAGNGWGTTSATEFAADPVGGGGSLSVTLNAGDYAGITISAVGFTDSFVEFSTLGVPFDGDGPLSATRTVTVSGGGSSQPVTVFHDTGKVGTP